MFLAIPGALAGLAEQRRLLVARDPGDRDLAAEDAGAAVDVRRGNRLGKAGGIDPEQIAELRVPAQLVDVEQHRPRGVRVVGDVSTGELEDEPGVDRPEGRARAPPRRFVEAIRSWWPRSRGRSRAPCAPAPAARARPLSARRSAPPCGDPARRAHGGSARRSAGPRRPPSRAGWRFRSPPGRRPGSPRRRSPPTATPPRHLPDLARVMLDPAGLRKVLFELRIGASGDPAVAVEDEAGGPGRALVDGEDQRAPSLDASWRHTRARSPRAGGRGAGSRRRSARLPGARGRARPRAGGSRRAPRRSSSPAPSRSPGRTARRPAAPRRTSPAGRRSALVRGSRSGARSPSGQSASAMPKPPPTRSRKAATARSQSPLFTAPTKAPSSRAD